MRLFWLGGATLAALLITASVAAAQAPVPCSGIGGGKYNCDWYVPGDGIHGGALVVRDRTTVGYLHQGTNWVICQQQGGDVHTVQGYRNHWFAWTQADNGSWGWASAVEARGGDNNGPFGGGVPNCNGAHPGLPTWSGRWGSPPPPAPPAPNDRDGDRVLAPIDCNDGDPAIRPGAHDVAGNRVDEDCTGADATATIRAVISHFWRVRGRLTRVVRLRVRDVTPGATVRVRCVRRGRGCRVRRSRAQVGPNGSVSVKGMLRRKRMRVRAVLEIRVTAPNATGRLFRLTMRRRELPKLVRRCLPPGATRSVRCS
jgi:hypothetical protein